MAQPLPLREAPIIETTELAASPPPAAPTALSVVQVFFDACVLNEGQPGAVVDWALAHGYEALDPMRTGAEDLLGWHINRRSDAPPGLRIAIPVACAYAKVPPLLFSALNLVSAIVWSASILGLIAWAGPTALTSLGVGGRAVFIVPGILVLLVFIALRRVTLEPRNSQS